MAKRKQLTKKMLSPLMRGELRKIAIVGLHLEPADAYTMKEAEITAWIYDRAEDLAKVDLDSIGKETFREGVAGYLEKLQGFIQGQGEAPVWPPEEEDMATVTPIPTKKKTPTVRKSAPQNPAVKASPKATKASSATPKRRGRPPKNKVVDTSADTAENMAEPQESVETKTAAEREEVKFKGTGVARFKKAKLNKSDSGPTVVSKQTTDDLQKALKGARVTASTDDGVADRLGNLEQELSELKSAVEAVRQEQTAANNLLANALLFVINSALLDEGEEIVDLSKIPSPDMYITEE